MPAGAAVRTDDRPCGHGTARGSGPAAGAGKSHHRGEEDGIGRNRTLSTTPAGNEENAAAHTSNRGTESEADPNVAGHGRIRRP
jgi:hypothetical protein